MKLRFVVVAAEFICSGYIPTYILFQRDIESAIDWECRLTAASPSPPLIHFAALSEHDQRAN